MTSPIPSNGVTLDRYVIIRIGDIWPKKLERELRASGRKKGFAGERLDRYVYGSDVMKKYLKKKK